MGNPGFRIHNAVDGVATIDIYADIDPWWGVSGESFRRELEQVAASHLEVHINSGGGDVHEGLAIMNSLRDHPAEVTVIVDGLAASAASFIAVGSGGRLVMHESSTLMIHDAWTVTGGDAAELTKTAATLDKLSDLIAGIYAGKSGTPVEEWRDAMREESWFTAEEAVLVGLADEVRVSAATEPVSVGMRSRVLNSGSFKYTSRADAPAPSILSRRGVPASANAPAGRKGETMGFLNDVAARLGVADTDLDEGKVLAALEEALAEQAEDDNPDSRAQSVAEAERALAEARAAAAADVVSVDDVKQVLDVVSTEVDGVEVTVNDDEATEEDAGVLTVPVDVGTLEELKRLAEIGAWSVEEDKQRAATEFAQAACDAGRITAAMKPDWVEAHLRNPERAEESMAKIPAGLVPRAEIGHGRTADPDDSDKRTTEISKAFGLTH